MKRRISPRYGVGVHVVAGMWTGAAEAGGIVKDQGRVRVRVLIGVNLATHGAAAP